MFQVKFVFWLYLVFIYNIKWFLYICALYIGVDSIVHSIIPTIGGLVLLFTSSSLNQVFTRKAQNEQVQIYSDFCSPEISATQIFTQIQIYSDYLKIRVIGIWITVLSSYIICILYLFLGLYSLILRCLPSKSGTEHREMLFRSGPTVTPELDSLVPSSLSLTHHATDSSIAY